MKKIFLIIAFLLFATSSYAQYATEQALIDAFTTKFGAGAVAVDESYSQPAAEFDGSTLKRLNVREIGADKKGNYKGIYYYVMSDGKAFIKKFGDENEYEVALENTFKMYVVNTLKLPVIAKVNACFEYTLKWAIWDTYADPDNDTIIDECLVYIYKDGAGAISSKIVKKAR